MKKILSILFASSVLVSCVDTVILPDNMTVEEDFWQKKTEVEQMVKGAYTSMASTGVQQRLIIWGARSDEYTVNSTINNRDLNQVYTANIQTNNRYNTWGDFYSVIGRCNLVIDRSAGVMSIDPTYQEGDHNANVAQMKALRALAYFYLIRSFRDVPLILEPVTQSSQDMNIPQSAPEVVLNQIIEDLEYAKNNSLSSQNANTETERAGYFTKDAVLALLADVYLWKGSVYHDIDAYTKCIECCDKIHDNRASVMSVRSGNRYVTFDDDDYYLNKYNNYYNPFTRSLDQENIFSLLYNNNEAYCNMFYKYKNASNAQPNLYTNNVYSKVDAKLLFPDDADIRGVESVFSFNNAPETGAQIRKGVSAEGRRGNNKAETSTGREYNNFAQNWNVYRITDVMLMRAEAYVQKAWIILNQNKAIVDRFANLTEESEITDEMVALADSLGKVNAQASDMLVKAARMATIVNQRARTNETPQSGLDSTSYKITAAESAKTYKYVRGQVNTYNNLLTPTAAKNLETIILNERARELCFEGKRWYDMLRYNYRHVEGVNYNMTLSQMGGNFVKNYEPVLDIIKQKYSGSAGGAVVARMQTEAHLYMPVAKSEVEVNTALNQNPVYTDNSTADKNY